MQDLFSQKEAVLHMHQKLGDASFAYGQTAEAEPGYYFNLSRLQYYVSEITLIHDGGQRTNIKNHHLLIDPAKDSVFALGNVNIIDLEEIEFWIGVDSAYNHLDPSTYPENHPLAHHDPSMHWGWAGGYRFIAMEGTAGYTPGFLSGNFQIHTIGDENYRKVSVATEERVSSDTMFIPIEADYSKLLRRVDVASGWESHSPVGKSKQVIINMQYVFTPVLLSSIEDVITASDMHIFPNPAEDYFNLSLPEDTIYPLTLTISNTEGRMVFQQVITTPIQKVIIGSDFTSGLYLISILDSQHHFSTEKIIVLD